MAKFLAGVGFGQASGSVAGTTYSRNRSGPYMRNRAMPVNPSTVKQLAVRSRLGNLAQAWRALTGAQRTQWNLQAPTFTLVDALGQSYSPSGFNLYQSVNLTRAVVGLGTATTPPAQQTQAVITSASATAVGATGVVTVTFAPAIAASSFYILRATAPMSAGKTFVARSLFKDVVVLDNADVSPYVATADYAATFGGVVTGDVGKRITMQLVPVSSNGYRGTPIEFTLIVS
jgi:hypothetical protein